MLTISDNTFKILLSNIKNNYKGAVIHTFIHNKVDEKFFLSNDVKVKQQAEQILDMLALYGTKEIIDEIRKQCFVNLDLSSVTHPFAVLYKNRDSQKPAAYKRRMRELTRQINKKTKVENFFDTGAPVLGGLAFASLPVFTILAPPIAIPLIVFLITSYIFLGIITVCLSNRNSKKLDKLEEEMASLREKAANFDMTKSKTASSREDSNEKIYSPVFTSTKSEIDAPDNAQQAQSFSPQNEKKALIL